MLVPKTFVPTLLCSIQIPKLLDSFLYDVRKKMESFCRTLERKMVELGVEVARVKGLNQQALVLVDQKLENITSKLKDHLTVQQREISRVVTPLVQVSQNKKASDICLPLRSLVADSYWHHHPVGAQKLHSGFTRSKPVNLRPFQPGEQIFQRNSGKVRKRKII